MANGWVLIDASAWIHALRLSEDPAVRQAVHRVLTEGRVATCGMIILELAAGTRTEAEYLELSEDLEALQQFPIAESVWSCVCQLDLAHFDHLIWPTLYYNKRCSCSCGTPDHSCAMSVSTLLSLAAVALSSRCHLFHRDKHCDLMARHIGLSVWTA